MDDILAKKNRHLFLEEKDNVGNSFIANVNNIVDDLYNIDAIANNLGRIDTVADNIDNINTVAENIDDINTTVENLDKIDTVSEYVNNVIDVSNHINEIHEIANLITTSAFNYSVVITVVNDINANDTLTLPDPMKYRVGAHMLLVSWNGVVCYEGEQYEEVGNIGTVSTTIKFKQKIESGDKIQFRVAVVPD